MATFTGDLTVTQLSGKPGAWRLWRLEQPLVYEIEASSDEELDVVVHRPNRAIVVEAGFVTDGPSIPRFLWAILPVWASWSRAGVVHDYLCCMIALGRPHPEAPTRTAADKIFVQAMAAGGVGIFSRTLLYIGVRIGTIFKVKTTMVGFNEKLRASKEAMSS